MFAAFLLQKAKNKTKQNKQIKKHDLNVDREGTSLISVGVKFHN